MLISAQNSNKVNCKIQDYFANRQIKEDVKCNINICDIKREGRVNEVSRGHFVKKIE
jgi:hypothetical protein